MPAKGTKPVTKDVFDAVTIELYCGVRIEIISDAYGIKPSTVRAIRQAKTWDEYERRKAAKVARAISARKANQPKTPVHIPVVSKRSYTKRVAVKREDTRPARKTVSVDDIEFQHPASKGDLKAMEDRLQKHLNHITDVATTSARDAAIHHAKIELEKPELHVARRLDNMDQSLIRIERVLQPVRRWFGIGRRG